MKTKAKMVNAESDVIERIYFKRDWRTILKHRNHIRIPTENPLVLENYVHDQPDSIWEIIDRDGIIVHDNDAYLSRIKENPTSVLDNPSDIYFIDRTTQKRYLQGNPGVMITTKSRASATPLKRSWESVLHKGDAFSWDIFFKRDVVNKQIPSNSTIIMDRYLLSRFEDGLQNLMDILDAILPSELNGDYHVLLVTDREQILNNTSISSIQQAIDEIQEIVPSLERAYEIVLEVLLVKPLGYKVNKAYLTSRESAIIDFYGETHNRRIISNYFTVSAEHGLCAVREDGAKRLVANFSQIISFKSVYSGINNEDQEANSLPFKICDDIIKDIRKFAGTSSPRCEYFINGKQGNIHDLRNRLIG